MEIENRSIVTQRVERANSYEFGKAGNRFKLFFETPEDLKKMVNELGQLGFPIESSGMGADLDELARQSIQENE